MGQEPDAVRRDIAATRDDMGRTIDEIEERVDPRRMVERRRERVRARWTGAKEKVMGSPSDGGTASAVSDLPSQARERAQGNPLAAGLLAFGTGLLAASLLPRSAPEQRAAAEVAGRAEPLRRELAETGQEVREELSSTVQEGVQATRETASEAAHEVGEHARGAAETGKREATDAAHEVREEGARQRQQPSTQRRE